jgi:hypothetical protein
MQTQDEGWTVNKCDYLKTEILSLMNFWIFLHYQNLFIKYCLLSFTGTLRLCGFCFIILVKSNKLILHIL